VLSRTFTDVYRTSRAGLPAVLIVTACLSGCASINQDVHRYYSQMAQNYKEAEDKAKMDALTLEGESHSLLQAGDMHGYNKAQKELARIKNWQSRCAWQRERFEAAAKKLEGPADPKKLPDQVMEPPPAIP
jgi:hypothetical protein